MSGSRRRFSVTVPDWGQDHLSSDAIVAYVDNELADGPQHRATRHLAECRECAAQVVAQGQARAALRAAACPSLPSSLLSSLRSIPQDADLPGPPPGLAMTSDGQLVSVLRPERLPESEPPAGLPSSALLASQSTRPAVQRRIRLGAGAAVSGLALGALALAAPGLGAEGPSATAANDRSIFGSPAAPGAQPVAATDTRERVTPLSQLAPLEERMDRLPASFLGLP